MNFEQLNNKNTQNLNILDSPRNISRKKRGANMASGRNSCHFCGGNLLKTKEKISRNGRVVYIDSNKCQKCGESFSNLKEIDNARKKLHPTFFELIRNFFSNAKEDVTKFSDKGRVL